MNAQDRRRKRRADKRRAEDAAVTAAALILSPSPEQAALAAVRAFADAADPADMGACSNCDHAFSMHAGDAGACSVDGCMCDGYIDPSATAAVVADEVTLDDGHGMTVRLTFDPAANEPFVGRPTLKARLENFVSALADDTGVALLPEHAPGATLPDAQPSATIPLPVQKTGADAGTVSWVADIVPEGALTDDGRAMAPGALTWRDLPLTLMAMIETTEGGHIGAEVSGRIDRIWREGNMVKASGVFDGGDYGAEIARLVGDGTLRGVSVDIAVSDYEFGPKDAWFDDDGNWAPKPEGEVAGVDLLDALFPDPAQEIFVVTEGVIGAVTVCPFAAFADARIMLAASLVAGAAPMHWIVRQQARFAVTKCSTCDDADTLITASAAGVAPVHPPAEWFADPGLEELTALTVTDDGHVFGHAWEWDTCHLAFSDSCVTAPHTAADYGYFHLKEVECADGSRVHVGTITLEAPHANQRLNAQQATEHYDHTGWAAADIVVGEDAHGGWFAGALRPDIDAERVRDIRGAVLSGDWRKINGNLELIGLLGVNIPGFPVPRVRALVAAGENGKQEVLALTAAGIHVGDGSGLSPEDAQRFATLALSAQA